MSALENIDIPVVRRRAPLRVLPRPHRSRTWPKATFPIVILSMLTISMVGQLVLQTKIQQQGFTLADLQTENYELNAQQALLQASVDKQSTPVQLAFSASNLGMVANPYSNLLVLPSGEIIGFSKKVRGNEARIVSATPTLPTRQVDDTPGLDTSQVNTPVPTEPGQATPNLHLSQGG